MAIMGALHVAIARFGLFFKVTGEISTNKFFDGVSAAILAGAGLKR